MYSTTKFFPTGQRDLEKFQASLRTISESYNKSFDVLRVGLLPAIKNMGDLHSRYLDAVSPMVKAINNYSKYLNSSGLDVLGRQKQIWEQYSAALERLNQHQHLLKSLDTSHLTRITSSLGSVFAEANIRNIDFSGLNDLNFDDFTDFYGELDDPSGNGSYSEGAGLIEPKKTLTDMTEEDLNKIITRSMDAAKKFSIVAFIFGLYSEYVNDAAKVILEVVFAFMLTTVTGQYNAEVKAEIIDTVQETKAVTDMRKVIIKYVKVNPTDQVAFLRKEAFLRCGASKKASVALKEKISTKTVLTIVERKNNWLKVEIDSGDFAGEIGWIEESKVTKFKKIK
ncbi:SH3 domain-containing protein [Bacillaceae bacterium C204]|uniref:SH3 domain-containing protein n=1 Tax=Neobacillus sp. 204 TaxID=3383351 RepID=UPI00397AD421